MPNPNAQGLYLWQVNATGRVASAGHHWGGSWATYFRVFVAASTKDIAREAALAWLQAAAPGVGEPAPDRIKVVMLKSGAPTDSVWRDGEITAFETSFAPR